MTEPKPEYESPARGGDGPWDADRVRRLRGHLGETQREFAARLGTRQQTVSEWETGSRSPRTMARRLLHLVAEEGAFYSTEARSPAGWDDASASRLGGQGAATRPDRADDTDA